MSMRIMVPALALALLASAAGAQTLADIEAAEAALVSAWEKAPLALRRAAFVTERAAGYGQYAERPNATFKPGEPLLSYLEPIGFTWKAAGANGFTFGVTLDYAIRTKAGQLLAGQERFMTVAGTSRNRVRELFLNVQLTLAEAPPGEYVLEYTLRDDVTPKTVLVRQPFQVVP